MNRLLLFLAFNLFAGTLLLAQQPAQYSLFMLNKLRYNPAYAGLDHSLSVTAGNRWQWDQLPGAPVTQFANVHIPVYLTRGGLGLQIENESLGPRKNLFAGLSYNFQLQLGSGILSFGAGAGFYQTNLNGRLLRTPDGSYENNTVINHEDVNLPEATVSGNVTTFQVGAFYQSDQFQFGIGVDHVTEPELSLDPLFFPLRRNIYAQASVKLNVSSRIVLEPNLLVKSDFVQTQTDVALIARYNENLFLGGGLRGYQSDNLDAAVIMAGFKISENITLGYAYDVTLSDLGLVSNGSHEILLNYNLNKRFIKQRLPPIIYNPRNL